MINFSDLADHKERLAVVGLGYVGLPLAVHLARHFSVVGYDLATRRIEELRDGKDRTREVSPEALESVAIDFTDEPGRLSDCRLIIVAVPTPIDAHRIPDLTPLKTASETVGRHLAKDACIVFESTVYPGATEEVCIPLIESASGLTFGRHFSVGYSPERINPGDRVHTLEQIVKVVSASDEATLDLLEKVYGTVVSAGIHRAPSIRVAEAAKVIENTQRDLNIALMNELSMIFDRMGIDTQEVLAAAETKWNFLPFRPGLVGGHCIGVDPYYLTYKAEQLGYHPQMILAGRRINDQMGKVVAEKTVKLLIEAGRQVRDASVAVLGLTFKENVPDLRNTRVVDIVNELKDYGIGVRVHDPLADPAEALRYYGIRLEDIDDLPRVDAVVMAVAHDAYTEMGLAGCIRLCRNDGPPLVLDLKGTFSPEAARQAGAIYWRL
jgi:UDP-N-acetyl-D-galactosamine dehydrogenase